MSDFTTKKNIKFEDPTVEAYSAFQTPYLDLRGPTSKKKRRY